MSLTAARKNRLRWGALIALVATVFALGLNASGALKRFEWITYDARMQLARDGSQLNPNLAVVLIDDASLQAMDPLVGRWPWPRSVYADLLDFMAMGGARAVVFDLLLSESDDGANDGRLAQANEQTGLAFHATQIIRDKELAASQGTKALPQAFIDRFALKRAQGFADRGANSYLLPLAPIYRTAHGIGVVGVDADADSVYRRVNLFSVYQKAVFPALSITALVHGDEPVRFTPGALHIGDQTVPLDRDGHYLVNMVDNYSPYSLSGILDSIQKLRSGTVDKLLIYPDEFENKIVFVGASATGLEDIKTTPLSTKTPGVVIHASVASNLLNGDFLKPVPAPVTWLLTLLLALLTTWAILGTGRLYVQIIVPLLLGAAYSAWSIWQFGVGMVYDVTPPLIAISAAWLVGFGFIAFTEGRDKRRVRGMLGQFVSPAVLNEVMSRYADHLEAEVGTEEHLTILFSDVRGFTGISEKLTASQVVELLNIHFSEMTEVIFQYEGTLDKFIGDAIMAFWGAPIRVKDHALLAVSAAMDMMRALERVNAQLVEKDYPALEIGIGLNTGDVVLGNIGSERKLDYTVIGDQVNLGSRLEGLTKQYGHPVIISEYTFRELGGAVPCAPLDLVRVKGKEAPIRIYAPLCHPNDEQALLARAKSMAELAEAAFRAYLDGQWDEAERRYRRLPAGKLADTFIARCRNYRNNPPPDDWDGVLIMTTK